MSGQRRTSAVVLISGGGTNLQAFIDGAANNTLNIDIALVVSNRDDAYGLTRAAEAGLETACIKHTDFADRESFDAALADLLEPHSPDIVALAGFMRILTPTFIDRFAGRIVNIHPSLLPKYPGLDTHQRAIEAGDKTAGSTVHFVTEELDGGPRIIQGEVPVQPGDDAAALAARVLTIEHQIYPLALRLLAEGRLQLRDGIPRLDGERLTAPIAYTPD